MPRAARWETLAALACLPLAFVPVARVPAAIALLCLLPGVAFCRHRLGETGAVRCFVLGSLLSLCALPVVAIPAAILAGRPQPIAAMLIACALTALASVGPVAPRPPEPLSSAARRQVAILAGLCLAGQIGLSLLQYPSADSIRWRGLPDLMFFDGIYTQIAHQVPPMDPENGAALLVHNWIYHFHFALLQVVSGLPVPAMQRVASAWMALVLLGLVYLLCHDVLKRPTAGLYACLLLMTSGEIAWLVRCLVRLSLDLRAMPWAHSPLGVTLLFGWYNLPPLAAGLGAWYWLERRRGRDGRPIDLGVSVFLCAAMAFFHPIFYGVFMIGFCLWLARLWRTEGARPSWLAYLATPLPFFLFYKLPYYGLAMPPSVVHPATSAAQVGVNAAQLVMTGGIFLALGGIGLAAAGRAGGAALGPAGWIAAASLGLRLLARAPNPHWFNDLIYLMLAIASGCGLVWISARRARAGAAVAAAALIVGGVSFGLHLRDVVSVGHTFTPGERAAGEWLASNTDADDLIATLPNSESSYTVLGIARRRLVHGWTGHLLDFHAYAPAQERDVRELFTTEDPQRAIDLARRYKVRWVYLGPAEMRAAAGGGRSGGAAAGPSGACFPTAFTAEGVTVRAFTCAAGGPAPARAAGP